MDARTVIENTGWVQFMHMLTTSAVHLLQRRMPWVSGGTLPQQSNARVEKSQPFPFEHPTQISGGWRTHGLVSECVRARTFARIREAVTVHGERVDLRYRLVEQVPRGFPGASQ